MSETTEQFEEEKLPEKTPLTELEFSQMKRGEHSYYGATMNNFPLCFISLFKESNITRDRNLFALAKLQEENPALLAYLEGEINRSITYRGSFWDDIETVERLTPLLYQAYRIMRKYSTDDQLLK